MNKNILVAGGAGFLGSHLCDRILEDGDHVVCLDNLSTGSKENILHLLNKHNFTFVEHDIVDMIDLTIPFDQIYNLASPASPINYQLDRIQTIKTNVIGSMNLLELAKKNSSTILQASTSEVYGDPEVHPQLETYWGNVNPIGPRSCYDEGKRCAETLFFDYNRQHDLEIKVVRIFNTYGPNMHPNDGRVVSNFIMQALTNQDITVYGNGEQTRSFCYIDDLIDGMMKMMSSEKTVTGPINLGNPVEFKIIELAQMIIKLTNSKSKIINKGLPIDDPVRRKPDISKAKKYLDWEPHVDVIDGLKETIDYFKKQI